MAKVPTNIASSLPSSFFQSFVMYDGRGNLDQKKSVKAFEEAFNDWLKEQGEIKPAILSALADHDRLGEGKLISFVQAQLRMKPTKENDDRVKQAITELTKGNKIVYQTTESGRRRGRGAGYVLSGNEKAA